MSQASFSTARLQMTVLSILSVVTALIVGIILLNIGLSVGNPGDEPTLEMIATTAAFTTTGVGALLLSFGLFATGVTLALLRIFKSLETESTES